MLVERIIHKMLVEKVDIDKLLVVTFTNAAASEMRERILEAIYAKLEEHPEDVNLQKQLLLLNKASICTIHSFCLDVIKNHFYELAISPNFRIGEEAEIELLKQDTLEDMFEEQYQEQDADFLVLIDRYTSYQEDQNLKDVILAIYRFIQATPFPEKWLEEKIAMFAIDPKEDFSHTIWGNIVIEAIQEELDSSIKALKQVKNKLDYHSELTKYSQTIEKDIEDLNRLKEHTSSWDLLYQTWKEQSFQKWPIDRKITLEAKEEAKKKRDAIKKRVTTLLDKMLPYSSWEIGQDRKQMEEILRLLQKQVVTFARRFADKKREKNIIDFNDIEHFALEILVEEKEDGTYGPTKVARKYQEQFEEIAVDEYQDSNLVQEYILQTISRKKNRFMVGDVKQSIYQFRQARPELFLEKYHTYQLPEERDENQDVKIQLFQNFRSRNNILQFTNLIFANVMGKELGGIQYDEKEYLNLGASFPENKQAKQSYQTELHVISLTEPEKEETGESEKEEPIENTVLEAKLVVSQIKQLIESNYLVYDKKIGYRPVTYKDIAILLRATSVSAPIYEKELQEAGIPVFSDSSATYLDSIEIQTIMSLLKIIDNPMADIPLVTVLRSSIGNFSDNELMEIRLVNSHSTFYETLQEARIQVNEDLRKKIDRFLENLAKWRQEKEHLALDELIWKLYMDTGYYHYVGLMPNGNMRKANLKMLFQRAKEYEKSSFKGLFHFIHFIEKLRTYHSDLSAAKMIGENEDVIRIMSIHKSKGLEFPIVFLAGTNKQFNMQDLNKEVLLDQDLGFGLKYRNYEKRIEYSTLEKEALAMKKKEDNLAEEMRILYVALTRSKEKLYITGVCKDFEKEWNAKVEEFEILQEKENPKIEKTLLKSSHSYLDWIEFVWIKEKKQMEALCNMTIHTKQEWITEEVKEEKRKESLEEKLEQIKKQNQDQAIEKANQDWIEKQLKWKYPHLVAQTIPTKISVTDVKKKKTKQQENQTSLNLKKPQFMEEELMLTPAEKGTVLHLCMQHLTVGQDYDMEKIEELLWQLWQKNILTKQEMESVSKKEILAFTHSDLWKEMKYATKVEREKPFYIQMEANEIVAEKTEEKILVQGMIDLYYETEKGELVLVDYKTDKIDKKDSQLLIQRYQEQLKLYQRALEEALGRKVDRTYLYATYLGKELLVP